MKSDSSNSQVLGLILVVIGIVLIVFYFYKSSSVQNSGAVTNDISPTQEEQLRRVNMMQRQEQIEGLQVQEENLRDRRRANGASSGASSEEMAQIKTSMNNKTGESGNMMDILNVNENFTQDRDQFPKDTLNPDELLPSNNNSMWNQVNPSGEGTLKDRNFLQSGYHIGINTVGQTLRNANLQLRSEPPCPQVKVSPWMTSTIEPDVSRRPFEISGC